MPGSAAGRPTGLAAPLQHILLSGTPERNNKIPDKVYGGKNTKKVMNGAG